MTQAELSAGAAPEFVDPASCKAWLDNVPLANVAAAQAELAAQIGEFNRLPTTPANRFAVMEHLREAVNFVQVEQARRFSNRALPMLEAEAAAFDATCALWQAMQAGYRCCLKLADEQAADEHTGALVCQRMLAYIGLKMFHHHRAYREVPAADWRALHETYARAEQLGLAEEPVKDFLNRDVHDTSPRIAYARAVLMGTCNPNELTQRQLTFVAYLLERWAAKLEIARAPVDEGEGVPPLVADLASDLAPMRGTPAGSELRYLDGRKLAKSLKNRVALLRKGESPARLALGEDCVQPSCEQLLVFLYRQWCQAKPARGADRRKSAAGAEACNEFAAVHYHVSGRHFRQPGGEGDYRQPEPFLLERWQIEEESAQGLRLARPAGATGKRYAHGQLVAVRPGDARTFMLGQIRWLMAGADGVLRAGLTLLPGIPAGIAARPTGLNVQNEKYIPALALGAVPPLGAPASLVLPSGWFRPKRVLELFAEAPLRVRLTGVLERGADFERIVYEPL
jgi:hypothetical protein